MGAGRRLGAPAQARLPWHIYGGRVDATEVAITFTGEGDKTTVTIPKRYPDDSWSLIGIRKDVAGATAHLLLFQAIGAVHYNIVRQTFRRAFR
jgi:hypothetical protein